MATAPSKHQFAGKKKKPSPSGKHGKKAHTAFGKKTKFSGTKTGALKGLNKVADLIKAKISVVPVESGRRRINFGVIIDDGIVHLDTTEEAKVTGAKLSTFQKSGVKFDPYEAGRHAVEEMQAIEGGAWTGAELDQRFSLTPATLHKRRKEHRVVFWRDAKHDFHYPKWQFTESGALMRGVSDVLQEFRSQDEWRVMRYFLGPRSQLADRTPLDLLREGEVEKVVAHAKLHVEENTW